MGDYAGFNQKSVWGINTGILDHQSSLSFINEFKQHFVLMLSLCVCVMLNSPRSQQTADVVESCGSNMTLFNQIVGKSNNPRTNWLLRRQEIQERLNPFAIVTGNISLD